MDKIADLIISLWVGLFGKSRGAEKREMITKVFPHIINQVVIVQGQVLKQAIFEDNISGYDAKRQKTAESECMVRYKGDTLSEQQLKKIGNILKGIGANACEGLKDVSKLLAKLKSQTGLVYKKVELMNLGVNQITQAIITGIGKINKVFHRGYFFANFEEITSLLKMATTLSTEIELAMLEAMRNHLRVNKAPREVQNNVVTRRYSAEQLVKVTHPVTTAEHDMETEEPVET